MLDTIIVEFKLDYRTYDQVKEESRKCLENKIDALAPGCGIDPNTPLRT